MSTPERNEEFFRLHYDLFERQVAGELTMEEFKEASQALTEEVLCEGDLVEIARFRSTLAALREAGVEEALKMALQLPGVTIPIAGKNAHEAN